MWSFCKFTASFKAFVIFIFSELPSEKAGSEDNHSEGTSQSANTVDPAVAHFTYEQVTRLLDLHSQLLEEPQKLQNKYQHLETISQDVSESISELKQAAEVILNKTKK